MDQPLSAILQEANHLAQNQYDIEPLSMDNDINKIAVHKAGRTNNLVKKSWRKPKDKPKRPLSAYNLFFQHEREKIITNNPDITLEETLTKISNTPKPKKRRHRKSHGMIGFADLARTIAEKWKTLDADGRAIYESRAGKEKQRYRKELEAWSKARDEKAKEDEKKSPLELARVEVVYDDPLTPLRMGSNAQDPTNFTKSGLPNMDSLSSILMSTSARTQPDYFKMTQQTLDMARASLSLPLFANIGVNQMGMGGNMMSPDTSNFPALAGAELLFQANNPTDSFHSRRLSASMLSSGMMDRHSPKGHFS